MSNLRLITWDADPLSEDDVRHVENAIGPLPLDYRQFLLTRNGGRTLDDPRFPLGKTLQSNYLSVTSFATVEAKFPPKVLSPGRRNSLFSITRGSQSRLIQIAECYDSPILMELGPSQTGSIYYWNYELEARWAAEDAGREYLPTPKTMTLLASSFDEFVEKLVCPPPKPEPSWRKMEPTVENYAKYGDACFDRTKKFFNAMTLAELNDCWPKNEEYAVQPIHYAANWSQVLTSKLLIDRGIDIHIAVRVCDNNFEITRMLIEAGATEDDLRALLLNASMGIAATSVPEENHKIIMHLLERGIRPDFDDENVVREWMRGIDQIYGKKILAFLLRAIDFPDNIKGFIHERLDRPARP